MKRSTIVILLLLFSPLVYSQGDIKLPKNFHQVNDRLYRSAQPDKDEFTTLKNKGVKTVINLRNTDDKAEDEKKLVESLGLRYFNVPFERHGSPTDEQIEKVLSIIENSEGVVLVHCKYGSDRTGVVVAIYRIKHDGWTSEQAIKEAEKHGMKFWQHGMKNYIKQYAAQHRLQS